MRKLFVFVFACLAFCSKSQVICGGSTIVITAPNPSNLTNPQYSLVGQPGSGSSNTFVVSPNATETFTFHTTGLIPPANNTSTTTISFVTVTVNPQPVAAPTVTDATCTSSNNAFNLNLTFLPNTPVPSFTVTFAAGNAPNGYAGSPSTSLTGAIGPGIYPATITAAGGCFATTSFTILQQPSPANFTLIPAGPNYSVTCTSPTINISANDPAHTYTFSNTGITAPVSNSEVALTYTDSGTYTVAATNTVSGCVNIKTFTLTTYTTAPTSTIDPDYQTINCNTAIQTVTLTSLSPTVNLEHRIIPPQGFDYLANNQVVVYQPGSNGTYTHVLTNVATGCKSIDHFTVFSSQAFPTYSVASQQNFSIGCAPTKSFAVVSFTGAQTSPTGGSISYSLLTSSSSTVTIPWPAFLTGTTVYTLTAPGNYTAIARDNANGCESRQAFSIITNTFSPYIDSVIIPRNVLDCNVGQTIMTAYGSSVNDTDGVVSYNWQFPGTPGNFAGQTYTAALNPTVAVTATVTNMYTLTIRDLNNTCISTTVIPIYQNLFPPVAKITGAGSITCTTPTLDLNNFSNTTIPNNHPMFPNNQNVVGFYWEGPSPQLPLSNSSTYRAEIVGVYTLTAMDMNNGCTSKTTTSVFDNRIYPVFGSASNSTLDCGQNNTKIFPVVTSDKAALAYSWTNNIVPTPTVSGANSPTLTSNMPGKYWVIVTNTVNNCSSTDTMYIQRGTLETAIEAGPKLGFAPLTVSLTNNSTSSLGNSSITTVWNFGNGTSSVTASTSLIPVTVYNLPGTYTVTAWVSKGICIDTVTTLVNVDIPSELIVPNVFTPNGDGVNDLFFIKGTNLNEINFTVINRWGHVVYELAGGANVAWDGKDQFGKEAAEGTYFYVITAKGKDGEDYNLKGNIALFR